jgi:GT2 family glycosyltransferase/glycosyltransferase involved in cell wall biosynthesis
MNAANAALPESVLDVSAPEREPRATLPTVTFVLVNHNGEAHLPYVLDSIRAQSYPAERTNVIVVDNASGDASLEVLGRFPEARVIVQESNVGFAAGSNIGARAASGDCVAFVNTDMRLDPEWLTEMTRAYDPGGGYPCVGGLILDWEGRRLDFADGVVNYHGMADQVGFGMPLEDASIENDRELLFACGASMLIGRGLFLELGGFDPAFFAYFEDVDLGWRLWVSGNKVRLAARARTFHRHHGTSASFPTFQKVLLLERNALRALLKNVDEENLGRLFGPALLLLIERVRLATGSSRAPFDLGAEAGTGAESVDRHALAPLHAVGDVVADLDGLLEERRRVQRLRRLSDAEIFDRFGRPFQPLGAAGEAYLDSMTRVTQGFRLDRIFERRRASRVLFLAYDVIGDRMAGPAVRSWEIAHAIARFAPVTLAFYKGIARESSIVELAVFEGSEELEALVQEADVVFYQGFSMEGLSSLRSTRALRVVDLYDPWIFEDLELERFRHPHDANYRLRHDVEVQQRLLSAGDFFICASERQRDYWLGMLTAVGRVERGVYEQDPTLRSLIDVVPYGCPDDPPHGENLLLRGVDAAIDEGSFVILWSGGTWEWYDPVLVLEAFRLVLKKESNARLVFMGLELEGRGVAPQKAAERMRDLARELGLLGREVVIRDWVAYDKRASFLLEADVGVIAARDLAESRLAFRSRAIDHFWAGLPTVTTGGDVLADLIESEGAGIVVPPGDSKAMAAALLTLIHDGDARRSMAERALALADRFRWSKAVEPLRPVIQEPWRWHALRSARATPVSMTEDAQRLLAKWRHVRATLPGPPESLSVPPGARAVWMRTPESVKRVLRPVIRRALR